MVGWPFAARAQKPPVRIGFLVAGAPHTSASFVDALRQGLHENGLIEDRDYILDIGWAEGDYARFPKLTAEMVRRNPSVILATTISAVQAAQRATTTIPIVMTSINDPVGAGLIESLARPGRNTTGLASLGEDVTTKLAELLRATLPSATVAAVLLNSANPSNPKIFNGIQSRAGGMGIKVEPAAVKTPGELDAAFAALGREPPDALLILPDFMLIDMRESIAKLALRYRLPTITNVPEYTDAGALISYGAPRRENYRRSARYVKRILDGENPSDMPVEQPTRIELSVNMNTAKDLGIAITDALLALADRVLE